MSRSIWKFTVYRPYQQIQQNLQPAIGNTSNSLIFQNRASFISEQRVNHRIYVHNGLRWYFIRITPERVGHRVGEFAPTRKRPIPKKKKQIKK